MKSLEEINKIREEKRKELELRVNVPFPAKGGQRGRPYVCF